MYGLIVSMTKRKNKSQAIDTGFVPLLGHYDQFSISVTKVMPDYYFSLAEKDLPPNDIKETINKLGENQVVYLYNPNPSKVDIFEQCVDKYYGDDEEKYKYKASKSNAAQYDLKTCRTSKVNGEGFQPRYIVFSLLTLDECAESYFSRSEPRGFLFKQLENRLDELVSKRLQINNDHRLDYSIFASLGTGDVAILWFTNALDLPMILLNDLRGLEFNPVGDFNNTAGTEKRKIFATSYSVVALIDKELELPPNDERLLCSSSDNCPMVDINITFGDNRDQDTMLKNIYEFFKKTLPPSSASSLGRLKTFKKKNVVYRYGNHDIVLRIKADLVPTKLFSYETEEDLSYQIHSRLYFPSHIFGDEANRALDESISFIDVTCDDAKEYREFFRKKASEEYPVIPTHEKEYSDLREKAFEATIELMRHKLFTRVSHLRGAFMQLLNELMRLNPNVCSHRWILDLFEQYNGCIKAIKCMISNYSLDADNLADNPAENSALYERIVKIIDALQQTFRHIGQSSQIYFDVSGGGLPYAGSHRKIVGAYYGIVKLLIETIYTVRRKSTQRKLLPLIVFSEAPTVEIMSLDIDIEDNQSLLLITLPYASLYNLPKYIRYLAHELHHYAAPPDRYIRNRIFGSFILSRLLSYAFTEAIKNDEQNNSWKTLGKNKSNSYSQTQAELERFNIISKFVHDEYEVILAKCGIKAKNKKGKPQPDSEWSQFLRQLMNTFSNQTNRLDVRVREDIADIAAIFRQFRDWYYDHNQDNNTAGKSTENIPDMAQPDTTIHEFFENYAPEDRAFIKLRDAFKEWDWEKELSSHLSGAIEACCDYFMIQMTNLDMNSYLNFVADYLYAHGFNLRALPKGKTPFVLRLGLMLHFFCSDHGERNISKEEFISRVHKLSNEWKIHNMAISKQRNGDRRDTERIDYRENMAELLDKLVEKYYDAWGPIFHDMKLLHSGNFNHIFNYYFDIAPDKQAYYEKKQEDYMGLVGRLQEFCERYNDIQTEGNTKIERCKRCFDLHMEMVEFFNRPKKLKDLDNVWIAESSDPDLRVSANTYIFHGSGFPSHFSFNPRILPEWNYTTYSFPEFINRYSKIQQDLAAKGAHFFWHRGEESSEYPLIPTIYREIREKNENSIKDQNLPEDEHKRESNRIRQDISKVQRMYFDHFMSRVLETNSLGGANALGEIDWLGGMQHHQAPTNLLDWSENLLVAMYFMLEPLIRYSYEESNAEIKKRKEDSLKKGVSLFVFDPIAYNKLWQAKKVKHTARKCELIQKMNMPDLFPLPNLSVERNANHFGAYVLGEPDICRKKQRCSELACENCPLQNPIAILTAQSNPRLRAQAGTFLAFSLHRTGRIDEAALEKLQEKWLSEDEQIEPFLYKITVKTGEAIQELADWTWAAGMNTYRTFPDLQYLGTLVGKGTIP